MAQVETPVAAAVAGQPIHSMLAQFPNVCFTLALLTDIAYWQTSHLMWQEFSSWLLFAGLVFGAFALIAGFIDFFFSRSTVRAPAPAWPHALGGVVVLALALLNSFVHAADGWPAVVPWGLILSALTVIAIIVNDWLGRSLVYRHGVGVSRNDQVF
ncbi:DUF2231 domain-containing protein [Bradyrhizobium sp. LHD-71]|uniref:DUF2231 domain-containing protein n=1 Tax=Bradyrhizobium sp. LHD-71 TaxID=3072141 RepID=UPI00280E8968|nr:DUF2231 domain-containing protein [Bradyrhizobium sp. LHD-71]MDQ8732162.1 DUF2231 domain-containing protein [Bradyrhizobium sp. LHD-71]